MENQHRLINTYRELTQVEIDLMNECKEMEARFLLLRSKIEKLASDDLTVEGNVIASESTEENKTAILLASSAMRSASIAKTYGQTAFMWLSRAVARPLEPAFEPPSESQD